MGVKFIVEEKRGKKWFPMYYPNSNAVISERSRKGGEEAAAWWGEMRAIKTRCTEVVTGPRGKAPAPKPKRKPTPKYLGHTLGAWADAIALRVASEWTGERDFPEDAKTLEAVLAKALRKIHPTLLTKLIGTGIIEEDYFEPLD